MKKYDDKPYILHAIPTVIIVLLLIVSSATPALAGDPDDTIGGINPNYYVCVDEDDGDLIDLDSDAVDIEGDTIIFNPDNDDVDLAELERDCDDEDGELTLFRQTRIEGYVYEFHPKDPRNPAESEWFATPSRDVLVVATGISFEIFWASEDNGFFYFDNLGAGPITLNLRLPPDARPLNPDVVIESTSFKETWTARLGFYRGDVGPEDIAELRTPDGSPLPLGDTRYEGTVEGGITSMPNVGGVLPQDPSLATLILAAVVLVVLPVVSFFKLQQNRFIDRNG